MTKVDLAEQLQEGVEIGKLEWMLVLQSQSDYPVASRDISSPLLRVVGNMLAFVGPGHPFPNHPPLFLAFAEKTYRQMGASSWMIGAAGASEVDPRL